MNGAIGIIGKDSYLAGDSFSIFRPAQLSGRAGVLSGHGWGGSGPPMVQTGSAIYTPQSLMASSYGMCVLHGDFGGTATFGNDASQNAISLSRTWFQQQGALPPALNVAAGKIGLFGTSMGGQNFIAWAAANPTLVSFLVLQIMVVDVERSRAENINGSAAAIEAAHGDNATWQTKRPTRNPIEVADSIGPIPTLVLWSENDPYYTAGEVADLAAAIGPTCTTVSLGAIGHAPTTDPGIMSMVADFAHEHGEAA